MSEVFFQLESILSQLEANLLIGEILFQRDAASHDCGQFGIVHHIGARVGCQVHVSRPILAIQPMLVLNSPVRACGVKDEFHESSLILVRHHNILGDYSARGFCVAASLT